LIQSITRRELLGQATALGGVAATIEPAREEPRQPSRPLKVIVTGGHPGDPEYGCGGTIARFADLGHEVVLLYLNDGEQPGKPLGGLRVAEAKHACEILKARPLFAGQVDGEAIVDRPHSAAFGKILEAERPDLVFTHWPIDNHADHRAISLMVYDAWLRMGRSFALYYYEVSDGEDTVQFAPTRYVDITPVEARKRSACFAHASQSPDKFYSLQDRVTRMRGIERGCRQAEGFIHHVQSPDLLQLPTV
jgi:LmbE family N-acetylglucosaminyl deacetylase